VRLLVERAALRPPARLYLRRLVEPRLSDFLAADVGLFLQDIIDGPNVNNVGRRDLVLILAAEMSHPDIDRLLEGKLRNTQGKLHSFGALVDDVRITH
jgi:hypothetical protein